MLTCKPSNLNQVMHFERQWQGLTIWLMLVEDGGFGKKKKKKILNLTECFQLPKNNYNNKDVVQDSGKYAYLTYFQSWHNIYNIVCERTGLA